MLFKTSILLALGLIAPALAAPQSKSKPKPKPPPVDPLYLPPAVERYVEKTLTYFEKEIEGVPWSGMTKPRRVARPKPPKIIKRPTKPSKNNRLATRPVGDVKNVWLDNKSWCWMNDLPDSTKLTDINIPGTHDSNTAGSYNIFSNDWIVTQYDEIYTQMAKGIRALDFRLGYFYQDSRLWMVHGDYHVHDFDGNDVLFENRITDVYRFLDTVYKSETIILSIQLDHRDPSVDLSFSKGVLDIINQNPKYWCKIDWFKNGTPTLGQCRGKIILFARFPWDKDDKPFGLYNFPGTDDTTGSEYTLGSTLVSIEDHYAIDDDVFWIDDVVNAKYEYTVAHARKMFADNRPNHLKITNSNGYQKHNGRYTVPESVAMGKSGGDGVNQRMRVVLNAEGVNREKLGIFNMDFATSAPDAERTRELDFPYTVVTTNVAPEKRMPWN